MEQKFEIETTEKQPVLSIREVTSIADLPARLGTAYAAIAGHIMALGEPMDGITAFTCYYNMDMDNLSVEMGFALNREAPGTDTIKSGFIPAGKKAVTLYKGAYRDMAPVYEAMSKWISESGHKPTGVVYEHYYNSPDEVPESELLTKIVFLLE